LFAYGGPDLVSTNRFGMAGFAINTMYPAANAAYRLLIDGRRRLRGQGFVQRQ
jgi:hypothetical protein